MENLEALSSRTRKSEGLMLSEVLSLNLKLREELKKIAEQIGTVTSLVEWIAFQS